MEKEILVAYASKYGATREIAEKIGEVLGQAGLRADVLPADRVPNLGQYRAVILGSAVYIGKWQKEAVAFLKDNEKFLASRPVWLFSSGPTGEGDPAKLVDNVLVPPALKPVVNHIQPRDITIFHGYNNPDKLNFIEKWAINSLVKKPMGDFRDWNMIAEWATRIADSLKVAEPG